ncbi:tripartite tricarboxylate transporter TctB family protein [Falsiroseomonas sp. E2-1-a4]|uniref:tripartite tricarboxylate transporter TctB family protein n=1 Tax=Falsiroseomonas sp. E2-1-a4 TaxID=3239299 RepID=UPI003F2AE80D
MSRAAGWAVLTVTVVVTAAAAIRSGQYGLWSDGEPGPGLFPLMACCLIGVAAVAVVAELRQPAPISAPALRDADEEGRPTPLRLAATMVIVVAWGLLFQPIGYAAASGLALFALTLVGGVGVPGSLAVAAGAVAATELLFVRMLEVPLPGPSWF